MRRVSFVWRRNVEWSYVNNLVRDGIENRSWLCPFDQSKLRICGGECGDFDKPGLCHFHHHDCGALRSKF